MADHEYRIKMQRRHGNAAAYAADEPDLEAVVTDGDRGARQPLGVSGGVPRTKTPGAVPAHSLSSSLGQPMSSSGVTPDIREASRSTATRERPLSKEGRGRRGSTADEGVESSKDSAASKTRQRVQAVKTESIDEEIELKDLKKDDKIPESAAADLESDDEHPGSGRGDLRRYNTKSKIKRLQRMKPVDCELTIDNSNRYIAEEANSVNIRRELPVKRADPGSIEESDSESSASEENEALCCEDRRSFACVVCRRRTPKEVCCYSLPYVPIVIFPFIVVNTVLFTIWLCFHELSPDTAVGGVIMEKWALFVLLWINSYLVLQVVFHFSLILLTALCLSSSFIFYTMGMEVPSASLVWAIALFNLWMVTLPGANSYVASNGTIIANCILVISILVVGKALLTKWLVGTQNRSYWWDRISESLYKEKVLEKLIIGPLPNWRELHAKEKRDAIGKKPNLSKATKSSVKSYEMFDRLATKIRRLNRMKITVKTRHSAEEDLPRWQQRHITRTFGKSDGAREQAATVVAKKLFNKLISSRIGPNFVALNDFHPYFKSERKASQAFAVFSETSNFNGFVTEEEMIDAVNLIYQDRQNIARNLKDRDHIGGVVSKMLNAVMALTFAIAFLFIIQADFTNIVVPVSSLIVGLSFIFGNSLSEAFSSFVFVVFVNAYSVGDMIDFADDFAFVREITLLTTRLDMIDGKRAIITNSLMSQGAVFNYTRSTDYAFDLNVHINMDTPVENIREFIRRLEKYIELRPAKWKDIWTCIQDVEHSQTLVLEIFVTLENVNWALWAFGAPKTQFMLFLQRQLRELGIRGHLAPQTVIVHKPRVNYDGPTRKFVTKKKASFTDSPQQQPYLSEPLARRASATYSLPERASYEEGGYSSNEEGQHNFFRSLPNSPRRRVMHHSD